MCNFSEALIEEGREREEIRGFIKNISNMQSYDLNAEQIMKFLSLDEETYLELSNLIHSHEDFTLDELVDEYFNSTNDADKENESDSENNII